MAPPHRTTTGARTMSTQPFIGAKEYFPASAAFRSRARGSDNPLAFKVYDANRVIGGKTMQEHLRFAVCYWHTFCNAGHDPFGPGTRQFRAGSPLARPKRKWTRRSSSSPSWACRTGASTISTWRRMPMISASTRRTSRTWWAWPRRARRPPASSCCGARPTCSRTRAT